MTVQKKYCNSKYILILQGSSDASPMMDADASTARKELAVYQQERDFFKQQYENLKASLAQPVPEVCNCGILYSEPSL